MQPNPLKMVWIFIVFLLQIFDIIFFTNLLFSIIQLIIDLCGVYLSSILWCCNLVQPCSKLDMHLMSRNERTLFSGMHFIGRKRKGTGKNAE